MTDSLSSWVRSALVTICVTAGFAASAGAADAAARCHGHFPNFLGYSYYRLDVTVYYHRKMNCAQAVQLAHRSYSVSGLHVIRDPFAFGGGGFGGPFQVGRFGCFLTARGSDFREAYCSWGSRAVYFYDHRESV